MNDQVPPAFLYFDLGKVLIDFDHELALNQLAAASDCAVEPIRAALFETEWPRDYERGNIDTAGFCQKLRQSIGTSISDDTICRAISNIFRLNRKIVPLLGALRLSGIPMGLLSNTCDAHWKFLNAKPYGILNLFPVKALSFQLGSIKPEPDIFVRACELAGVPPARIFFTDDLEDNVAGARSAGMDAELFTGVGELRKQLEQRGLHFNV